VTPLIQKKPSLAVNTHCEKIKKKRMNTHPADDPRTNIKHPEHLDYFSKIVCENMSRAPVLAEDAYVAPGAFLAGDVTLRSRASVWPSASLRADIAPIVIGEESNVQDNAVIHVATGLGVSVGKRVTIGHGAIVHACTIGDESLIGMGAIILDGAMIGERCLIGAHATVLMNTVIPPGSMVVGSPARIVRTLTPEEQSGLRVWADHYLIVSAEYKLRGITNQNFHPLPSSPIQQNP
jgi:gamma-carbonic anhydrase